MKPKLRCAKSGDELRIRQLRMQEDLFLDKKGSQSRNLLIDFKGMGIGNLFFVGENEKS